MPINFKTHSKKLNRKPNGNFIFANIKSIYLKYMLFKSFPCEQNIYKAIYQQIICL